MAVSEIARSGPLIVNVDHAESTRCARHRTLSGAGYEVVDAASGADALARIEALRPALVLLDAHLPDIRGVDVCKVIKQRWPTTMVLQTSGSTIDAADRVRGLEGGADAYLMQPIDSDVLVASVRALMRLHQAEHATR